MVARKPREERTRVLNEKEDGSIWNPLWGSEQRLVVKTTMNIWSHGQPDTGLQRFT